jgi:hypothetical protein
MPFVYVQTEDELPEDGADSPPRADQFIYLPPPELGGARPPVHFSVAPIAPGTEAASPPPEDSDEEEMQQQDRQQLFAIAIPELRASGARRVYCRYDGGNDEGFSWLDGIEMQDGARITGAALAQRLQEGPLLDKLIAADMLNRDVGQSAQQQLQDVMSDWLCAEWATMLLGEDFGTGEYSMYGAFTVDLDACTIIDDRNADPVVQNIEIAE